MADLLARIDAAVAGLCPCGGQQVESREPTRISITDIMETP